MAERDGWRAPVMGEDSRRKPEALPPTIAGLLSAAGKGRPRQGTSLSLFMKDHELADAGIPVTVRNSEALMKPAPRPSFEALAAQERAARPELAAMAREPRIAKAMDEAFAASKYGEGIPYHGEAGGYIAQDSSGDYFAQPYVIEEYGTEPGGIWTRNSRPQDFLPPAPFWPHIENFVLNRKIVGQYHAHPNGKGWQAGPSKDDIETSNNLGLPVIVRAPDGVHYGGAEKPERPAPYHGLFDWSGN